jgi:hypothetical protein
MTSPDPRPAPPAPRVGDAVPGSDPACEPDDDRLAALDLLARLCAILSREEKDPPPPPAP